MSTTPKPTTPPLPERLLTITEVADALGVDVRHVRRLVHERRIPFIKWGHLLRFDPADITAWVDAYRYNPTRPGSPAHTPRAEQSTRCSEGSRFQQRRAQS